MNVYFDTEFTGLVPNTTPISFGMIDDEGAKFYAEFTDYDRDLCDEWIRKNVINNLIFSPRGGLDAMRKYAAENFQCFEDDLQRAGIKDDNERNMFVRGSSNYISEKLRIWLEEIPERVQLVSDVCHYDMYLLCNLFGGAFQLPKNVNPVCYDICQDIAIGIADKGCNAKSMQRAFDESREELCIRVAGKLPEGAKHNSLYDAEVIKMIHDGLWRNGV